MGETQLLDMARQLERVLAIRKRAAPFLGHAHPRTEMDLVNGDGRCQAVLGLALLHPGLIGPGVVEAAHHGGRLGRHLAAEGKGVGLFDAVTQVARGDVILVDLAFAQTGKEPLPDAGAAERPQLLAVPVPAVEVAHDRHRLGIGRPDREVRPLHALMGHDMRAELVIEPVVRALVEEIEIVVGQEAEVVADRICRLRRRSSLGHRFQVRFHRPATAVREEDGNMHPLCLPIEPRPSRVHPPSGQEDLANLCRWARL